MNALFDITPLIAEAGWHHDGGWWPLFGLLWLALLGTLIWLVVRQVTSRRSSATHVLAERYARGEIDDDEYRKRLDVLRSRG
jgi:putative membrane protein